jgi:hypothetical protein
VNENLGPGSDLIVPETVGTAITPSGRDCKILGQQQGGRGYILKLNEEQTRALAAELAEILEYWDGPAHRPGIAP